MRYAKDEEVSGVTIGQRLQQLRQQKRLTQREVAAAAGISTTHLSDLEHDRKRPSAPMVVRLARALGIEPGELFEALYAPETRVRDADGAAQLGSRDNASHGAMAA